MIISEAIEVLESALGMFGDIDVTFLPPDEPGEKAKIELKNVDSTSRFKLFFPETGYDENSLSGRN